MILCQIEKYPDLRVKINYALQLKTTDFYHNYIVFFCFQALLIKATPMLPNTWVVLPEFLKISPTKAVVVVLPLVPVMAIICPFDNLYANSISPIISIPLFLFPV